MLSSGRRAPEGAFVVSNGRHDIVARREGYTVNVTRNQWKIVGASAAVAGLGVGGMLGIGAGSADDGGGRTIELGGTSGLFWVPKPAFRASFRTKNRDVAPRGPFWVPKPPQWSGQFPIRSSALS